LVSEAGKMTVLKADPQWEVLSVNDLGEDTLCHPGHFRRANLCAHKRRCVLFWFARVTGCGRWVIMFMMSAVLRGEDSCRFGN
jgi:hypothetical protein